MSAKIAVAGTMEPRQDGDAALWGCRIVRFRRSMWLRIAGQTKDLARAGKKRVAKIDSLGSKEPIVPRFVAPI